MDLVSLDKVLQADIICLHTPLTTGGDYPTRNMLSYKELSALPEGALLINAGRGGVINESDLKQVLAEGKDIKLIFDVWQNEPCIDSALVESCAIATPHIAGYANASKLRGSEMVFEALFKHFDLDWNISFEADNKTCLDTQLSWSDALLKVFNPLDDDAALRRILAAESNPASAGQGFDQLRKNYPKRTEISDFSTSAEVLQAFGFSPAD